MRPAWAIEIGVLVPAFRVRPGTAIYDLANMETMVAAAAQGFTPAEYPTEFGERCGLSGNLTNRRVA
jgi:hypothetical protein